MAEAAGYRIRWRRADGFAWTDARNPPASATSFELARVRKSKIISLGYPLAKDGAESLVNFADVRRVRRR